MSRDSNGNYNLPAGNPVVTDTLIEATWANTTLGDVANELSDSLSRSGKGGMLAPFKNADGTVGAPGVTFTNEPTSGMFRKATRVLGVSIGGSEVLTVDANGIALAAGKTITGSGVLTQAQVQALIDASITASKLVTWPVGSIFISMSATNPAAFIGGSWTQIAQGRMLLGVGGGYSVGQTGGEERHVLTEAEMPVHLHYGTTGDDYPDHQHYSYGDTSTLGGSSPYITYKVPGSNGELTSGATARHVHNFATASTGGGGSHNNMPPYIATYIWQRTA